MRRTLIAFVLAFALVGVLPLAVQASSVQKLALTDQGGGTGTSLTDQGGGTGTTCGQDSGALQNPLKVCTLTQLLAEIMKYVVELGTIFLTLMIIYTGFKFIAARGNEEKISSARTSLLWTVIGGLLLLGASVIANAISTTAQNL